MSDKITLLIFKDNEAARTFQISLSWITRCAVLLSFLLIISCVSFLAAFQYYRIASKTDPTHVQDLEEELVAVKLQLKSLEGLSGSLPHSSHPAASTTAGPSPVLLFAPSGPSNETAPGTPLPFTLEALKSVWFTIPKGVGKFLKVSFAIQYQKNDQGSQQGRILILARGSAGIFTYPTHVINPSGQDSIVSKEKGELFSVSRYRQVNADFGPILPNQDLTEVEVFIFSKEGQLLVNQKVPLPEIPAQIEHHAVQTPTTPKPKNTSSFAPDVLSTQSTEEEPK